MHFKWNYESPSLDRQRAAKELGEKLNISPILANLLIDRSITTESAAKRFFRPQLADLINPFLMKDMDKAVERILRAIDDEEKMVVFGDYDVDGVTATALLYSHLRNMGADVRCMLPSREGEGYGLS